jgi:acetyl-CoA acetyltransferase
LIESRRLTTRLLHAMERDGLKRGIVALCIGGGHQRRPGA